MLGMSTACGATFGTSVLLLIGSISVAGIYMVLNEWLTNLHWVGRAYLIFLGVKQWFYVLAKDNFYAILAGHARKWMSRTNGRRLQNRHVGVLFLITGAAIAFLHQY